MNDEERRAELVHFLRTKRACLSPERMGFPSGNRRRTPGLRREEVAQLANVSVEWYTRLEQGRDIRLSTVALENITQALSLNADERVHLFHLARQEPPPPKPTANEKVSPSLQRFLDALGTNPAYVLGRRWDRLAWNEAACAVFEDFGEISSRERNVIWSLFVNPARRRLHVNWEAVAQRALAEFRASYGRYAGDPTFTELVEDLQHASQEFRLWWLRHTVQGSSEGEKFLEHPLCGKLALEHHTFQINETPTLRLVVYTPLVEENTFQKIEQLLDARSSKISSRQDQRSFPGEIS